MKMAVEYARSTALLVTAERPPPAIEVETRAALEAASVTWWLFAPGLTARQLVCRLQLPRRNSDAAAQKLGGDGSCSMPELPRAQHSAVGA